MQLELQYSAFDLSMLAGQYASDVRAGTIITWYLHNHNIIFK